MTAMTSASRRESLILRAAEPLRGSERAERLGATLTELARETANTGRQIATLKRENAALRAQLGTDSEGGDAASRHRRVPPPIRLAPLGIGGRRRG